MNRKTLIVVAAGGVVAAAAGAYAISRVVGKTETPAPVAERRWVKVEHVRSGDRIKIKPDDTVVYAGIRAPLEGETLYEKAKQRNEKLVTGKRVRLRFDEQERDKKGRLLAYAFVDKTRFVNWQLVREGLAYVRLTNTTRRFSADLLAAQAYARRNKKGLWKHPAPAPAAERCLADPKYGNFHRPSCGEIPKIDPQRIETLATRSTAFDRGFAPCNQCRP